MYSVYSNENEADCPTKMKSGWEFMHPEGWIEDTTLSISCSGDQPTPSGRYALLFNITNHILNIISENYQSP